MCAWLRSLPLAVLAATLIAAGCSSVTDFDRFHDGEDGGAARDSSMDSGRDGGGGTDAGPCEDPVPEECNGSDDDCDGMVDEDFDLDGDPTNCGSCGRSCPDVPNSGPGCAGGDCVPECDADWADCNGDYIDGCEVDLTSPDSCTDCDTVCEVGTFCSSTGCVSDCPGSEEVCGRSCVDTTSDPARCGDCDTVCDTLPHSSPTCDSGTCGFECDVGWSDCNDDPSDGCETDITTVNDCGDCDVVCSYPNGMPACNSGTCELEMCNTGYEDCNTDDSDGCEADLGATDTCGDCTTTCAEPDRATGICDTTGCDYVCDTGWEDCNGLASDGCEADLSSAATCGDCSTACSGGTPVCSTSGCVSGCSGSTPTLCSGSCVDTNTNPLHCGTCDDPCPEPTRSTATCSGGTCGFTCDTGWDDCDSGVAGCETSLTTLTDCGSCGTTCTVTNGTPTCSTGSCAISSCDTGWADCGGGAGDGCETDITTTTNCRSCGTTCTVARGTPGCGSSGCVVASCDPGWGDCNSDYSDGCETDLPTFYRDDDGDGYGDDAVTTRDCSAPSGFVSTGGDCDDGNFNANPGQTERCNTFDDDCDGTINEGFACGPGDSESCTMTTGDGCSYVGTRTCNAVSCSWGSCMPPPEVCNAADDDCDGYADENQLTAPAGHLVFNEEPSERPRIAYSPDLERFGVVWSSGTSSGTTRTLWIATIDFDGSLVTVDRLRTTGLSYDADITWDGSSWYVVISEQSSSLTWEGLVGQYDESTGVFDVADFGGGLTGTQGVRHPRVDVADDGSGTVGIVWWEGGTASATNWVRFAAYLGLTMRGATNIDSTTALVHPPAVSAIGGGEFALAWGSVSGGTGTTRYTRSDVLATGFSILTLHTDSNIEMGHELEYSPSADEVMIGFTDQNSAGTRAARWSHGNRYSLVGTKVSLPSGDRALVAWADDGALTVAYGSSSAAGALRRFRDRDYGVVPGDVTLGAGQVGDIASVLRGSPRHAISYISGGDVYVRFIECM